MAARKKSVAKVATRNKAGARRSPAKALSAAGLSFEEALRARDIVLERIESQLRFVAEAVVSLQQQMDTKLTALEERLSERISILEQVVRKNSEDIRKNSEDIRQLQAEVARLRQDFDRRQEVARVEALEERVARVEARLGIAS